MSPLPTAAWQAALTEMEAALADTLAALDRYQEGWGAVLAGSETGREPVDLSGQLSEWDARLNAAAELAASVERQLNDREAALGRWQEAFAGWRDGLEQQRVTGDPLAASR